MEKLKLLKCVLGDKKHEDSWCTEGKYYLSWTEYDPECRIATWSFIGNDGTYYTTIFERFK